MKTFAYVGIPRLPSECHDPREYKNGALKVFVSQDSDEKFWHLSISHPDRYPTWDEIHSARYELVPDEVTMAMFLPPKSEYVNLHSNCFHLHETREKIYQTLWRPSNKASGR